MEGFGLDHYAILTRKGQGEDRCTKQLCFMQKLAKVMEIVFEGRNAGLQ